MKKYVLFAAGVLLVIIGTIGILIPIFPTVPFYVAAAYCFSKASGRFKKWLQNNALYKKYLKKYIDKRL